MSARTDYLLMLTVAMWVGSTMVSAYSGEVWPYFGLLAAMTLFAASYLVDFWRRMAGTR